MVAQDWIKRATVDWRSLKGLHIIRAPIASMRDLLTSEDAVDGNTRRRFEAWARGDCRDPRFETDTRIASEMKGGFVDDYHHLNFGAQRDEAAALAAGGHLDAAAWLYMGMTESIGVHMSCIDDSGGYVWPFFEECMDDLGLCILGQNLPAGERRWYVEYLAGWSLAVFGDLMECYNGVLGRLCSGSGDLDVWRRILERELEEGTCLEECDWAASKGDVRGAYLAVLDRMKGAGPDDVA